MSYQVGCSKSLKLDSSHRWNVYSNWENYHVYHAGSCCKSVLKPYQDSQFKPQNGNLECIFTQFGRGGKYIIYKSFVLPLAYNTYFKSFFHSVCQIRTFPVRKCRVQSRQGRLLIISIYHFTYFKFSHCSFVFRVRMKYNSDQTTMLDCFFFLIKPRIRL